ncbi:MAG: PmoA family protein [Pirellulaceae bacterium]
MAVRFDLMKPQVSWMLIVFIVTLSSSVTFAQESANVQIQETESGVDVTVDETHFISLDTKTYRKPIWFPVHAAGQIPMTRSRPMLETAGEANDHPHHKSIWFAHGDVDGIDFWTEKGLIENQSVVVNDDTSLTMVNHWMGEDGPVVNEETTVRFGANESTRWMDWQITLSTERESVKFGDTKEGMIAVRVHPGLRISPDEKQGVVDVHGHVVNSEGDVDNAAWGKRAKWVRYDGVVENQSVAILIMDHPDNFRYPTPWHARGYGLFAANPFGLHDFGLGEKGAGDFQLKRGEELTFRYRMLFISRDLGDVDSEKAYETFAAGKHEGAESVSHSDVFSRLCSDSIRVSHWARAELSEIFATKWEAFENVELSEELRSDALRNVERIRELSESSDHETAIVCLETMARLQLLDRERDLESATRLLNDTMSTSMLLRQQAFRNACLLTDSSESVLERIDDLGMTFDLYRYHMIIDENKADETIRWRYAGFVMEVENWFEFYLARKGKDACEVKFLASQTKRDRPKIVRMFSYLLLACLGENAAGEIESIKEGMNDDDEDIRFASVVAKYNVVGGSEDVDEIIASAKLSPINSQDLKKSFDAVKR